MNKMEACLISNTTSCGMRRFATSSGCSTAITLRSGKFPKRPLKRTTHRAAMGDHSVASESLICIQIYDILGSGIGTAPCHIFCIPSDNSSRSNADKQSRCHSRKVFRWQHRLQPQQLRHSHRLVILPTVLRSQRQPYFPPGKRLACRDLEQQSTIESRIYV